MQEGAGLRVGGGGTGCFKMFRVFFCEKGLAEKSHQGF